jgi:hypothetical protein
MRDHVPVLIDEFNGFWKRGDDEAVPLDHFSDVQNIAFFEKGFRTRDGINPFIIDPEDCINMSNVKRIYAYVAQGQHNSMLVLDNAGNIFHTNSPTPCVPILTVIGMDDFAFVSIAGRAYISPNNSVLGLENEFIYVYKGDGTPARKAAGAGPSSTPIVAAAGGAGNVEAGTRIFGVVYETDTGFLTQVGGLVDVTLDGTTEVDLSSIPTSLDTFVIARHIVATRAINPTLFTGDLEGYQLFFVPDGEIPNNVATTISVNFYDADLLDDASHLLDILSEIPAAVAINTYHERMVLGGMFGEDNKEWSLVRASVAGEPEAFDAVNGLFYVPADDYPITNVQEYRDVLYVFKQIRTYGVPDNGDYPASWPVAVLDQGIGAATHGIAAVLDSGGVNIDYLIIVDYSGVMLFNGSFQRPELSYKIKDYWMNLDRDFFYSIQILNDSLSQIIYATLPNQRLLVGYYENGLDAKSIKWSIWKFDVEVSTITLINTNTLIIGATGLIP